MKHFVPALLLTACPAAAQLQFDVIYYDAYTAHGGGAASQPFAILVNTGSVPITRSEWFEETLQFSEVSTPMSHTRLQPFWPFGPQNTLLPGQAWGKDDPMLKALLAQGETFTAAQQSFEAPVLADFGPEADGTAQTLRGCIQLGDRRVTMDVAVTLDSSAVPMHSGVGTSATRVSATSSAVRFENIGPGCAHPDGAFDLRPLSTSNYVATTTQETVSTTSNMPVVGNPHLVLSTDPNYSPGVGAAAGMPWILVFSLSQDGSMVDGCTIHPLAGPSFVATGVVDDLDSGGILPLSDQLARVHYPVSIPDQQSLVGSELWVQLYLVTPTAANGSFAASDGLRIVIGACP